MRAGLDTIDSDVHVRWKSRIWIFGAAWFTRPSAPPLDPGSIISDLSSLARVRGSDSVLDVKPGEDTEHNRVDADMKDELQAVILAAGYARRMRPLSESCHKALLPVGGTTILGRILDGLLQVGIRRVTVVTGYRASDVEDFVHSYRSGLDVKFVENQHFADTNNVVSLSMALDDLTFDADVVLIECDLLFDPSLLNRLIAHPGRNVALVDLYRTGMDGTVVAVKNGFVTEVHPTDVQGADFSYADKYKTLNIYRFDREFCRTTLRPLLRTYANDIDSSCYYELVLGMLSNIPAHRISAEDVGGERWVEVDDPNDLAVANYMFDPGQRPSVLDRAFGGHWNFDLLDFSFMRNAYFPSGAMLAAMRHALPELVWSYGSTQSILNEKLGFFLHCDPARLQVLHGATQAFPVLRRAFANEAVTLPTPTFGEYPRMFPDAATYADEPGIEWAKVAQAARDSQVLVIVNPNSPTGSCVSSEDIYGLAARTPETVFWVDESFIEFSDQPSLVPILEQAPLDNVIILTSLSKSLGVPGLRLGYLYSSNRELRNALGAELPVWNLSAPAEFLLELLVKFTPAYAASIDRTKHDRDVFREQLGQLKVIEQVYPSEGNFLLVHLADSGPDAARRVRRWLLEQEGIEVKDVSDRFPDAAPRLRLAVRAPVDNMRLLAALDDLPSNVLGTAIGD